MHQPQRLWKKSITIKETLEDGEDGAGYDLLTISAQESMFSPQNPHQNLDPAACPCNPKDRKPETSRSLGFAGQPA